MSDAQLWPLQLFDPAEEVAIVERNLPHWSQAGAIAFITFRTQDSMPKAIVEQWIADRDAWLKANGIDPRCNWGSELKKLDRSHVKGFRDALWNRWHESLDACYGACELRRPALAQIVADSLRHFDEQRYLLLDYVVMPNHVHVLCSFPNEKGMLEQCDSWKHYTAVQINRRLAQKGRFWQQDAFDHLVRSEEQFQYLRRYISANPERARLRVGEYLHYSRSLT
jgi:putative transposase